MAMRGRNFISMAWYWLSSQYQSSVVRIWVVFVFFLALFGVEGMKLAYLHLGDHSKIQPRKYTQTLVGKRGRIYDRNGTSCPMAYSLPAWQFYLDPYSVKTNHNQEAIAQAIATNLDLDIGWVREQFGRTGWGSHYIKLAVSQNDRVYRNLMTNTLSGIGATDLVVRRYPQGQRMSQVLGFVNNAGQGGAGIEQEFDRELTAVPGVIEGEKDAKRREIFTRRTTFAEPIPGHDIFLTLDHNIQYVVENELKEAIEKFNALGGWAIVERVKTGEILAMAAYPDYNPEHYNDVTNSYWINSGIARVYEPGSIMKAVTVSAFLNERLGTPNTIIDVGEGMWFYGGKPLRDHATGRITVATALKKSSNIACAKMGLALGDKRFYGYLRAFNFGSKLGIDLPGEEFGILPRVKDWSMLTPTRIAMGQGIAVTALQMITAYSAIANDGVMMRPYIVDRIVAANGEIIRQNRPDVIGCPIRPEIARQVREMLIGVTEEGGTGKRAVVPGYSVGGKTGTAQKVVDREDGRKGKVYSNTDYFASFIGFVPASNPVFTVLVTVDRPGPQHTGGFVSAPAFAKIASATARYLEVPPDEPAEIEDEEEPVARKE
jgi:cell division protein FtsI (penicillin-binding protein 3)